MYLALSTYNTEFVALILGTINLLVECEFLLASGRRWGSPHCCFGSANRDDSFHERIFDVSYSTFLKSFGNQTPVCHLG